MIFRLVVRPEVDTDLLEAETWYNEQRPGLGQELLRDVRDTIDRLIQNPFLFRVRHQRLQIRWCYTRRFPYRIVFNVIDDIVVVYTVIHGARQDRHWKKRVTE